MTFLLTNIIWSFFSFSFFFFSLFLDKYNPQDKKKKKKETVDVCEPGGLSRRIGVPFESGFITENIIQANFSCLLKLVLQVSALGASFSVGQFLVKS